jgi:hypothetical protein
MRIDAAFMILKFKEEAVEQLLADGTRYRNARLIFLGKLSMLTRDL